MKVLHKLCAEKLTDIINGFSESEETVVVGEEQTTEDVVVNCLYALIKLILS